MKKMLRLGIAVLLLTTLAASSNEEGYDGFKIFEVVPKTPQQSEFLYDLSKKGDLYDFFALRRMPNRPARVMVHRNEIANFLSKLSLQKLDFKILNENVGRSLEEDFKLNMLQRHLKPAAIEGRLSTDRYYSHAEVNEYIDSLATLYPSRVVVEKVGESFQRRDLKTIKISNGDGVLNKSVILMDAGMHAREWIAPATILYVIKQLVENYEENAELLLNYDYVILPVVNPDGYEYSRHNATTRYWRKTRQPYNYKNRTCYGSDPNRNFGVHWNETGSSTLPCSGDYAGPRAFSEPETAALRDLMQSFKGRGKFYLSLHSYGNLLLYPWGWTYDFADDVADFEEIARVGADAIFNATGVIYETGSTPYILYIVSGASHDYAYASGFNVSITMELSGTGNAYESFAPPPSAIDDMVKEAWFGIRAMCKKVIAKY